MKSYLSVEAFICAMSKRSLSEQSIDLFSILNFMFDKQIAEDLDSVNELRRFTSRVIGSSEVIQNKVPYRERVKTLFDDIGKNKFNRSTLELFRHECIHVKIYLSTLPNIFREIVSIMGVINVNNADQSIAPDGRTDNLFEISIGLSETASKQTESGFSQIRNYFANFKPNAPDSVPLRQILPRFNRSNLGTEQMPSFIRACEANLRNYNIQISTLPYAIVKSYVIYSALQRQAREMISASSFDGGIEDAPDYIDGYVNLGTYIQRFCKKAVDDSIDQSYFLEIKKILKNEIEKILTRIGEIDTIDGHTASLLFDALSNSLRLINENKYEDDGIKQRCDFINMHTVDIKLSSDSLSDFFHGFCGKSDANEESKELLFAKFRARSQLYSFHFPPTTVYHFKDSVFAGRYNINSATLDEHLSVKTMLRISKIMSQNALRTVIAGGMSVLLRYNVGDTTRTTANTFIHSFSPKPYDEREQSMDEETFILHKINTREDMFQRICNRGYYGYISNPEMPRNKNAEIDRMFGILKNNSLDERDAFKILCNIDVINCERILLFGIAVLFRGAVEIYTKERETGTLNYYSRLLGQTHLNGLKGTLAQMDAAQPGSSGENLRKWYNILSCIIHATNTDESRLFNENTYRNYMKVIRWELLNLFEIFYSDPAAAALISVNPRTIAAKCSLITTLELLDRMTDRISLLSL
jgi:hypothetical protein